MRRFALNFAVAVVAFMAGSLATGIGSLISRGVVYALAQQLPLLILQAIATFCCFALAASGVRRKTDIAFTLLMLFCGVVILLFMAGTIAGATLTGIGFD